MLKIKGIGLIEYRKKLEEEKEREETIEYLEEENAGLTLELGKVKLALEEQEEINADLTLQLAMLTKKLEG